MSDRKADSFTDLMKDSDRFMLEVNKAVQETLRVHKMLGHPVVVWRDGQVVWVPPEEIPVDDKANGESPKLPYS